MPVEDERRFQSSNKCWICNKLFAIKDKTVRDHDNTTGNYIGASHSICNINIKLAKGVPVIFYNLRSYGGHLIMQEISKFDADISVKSNGLEKCMAFTINKNLIFIESMQLMNSILDELVKNVLILNINLKNLLVIC